MTRTDLLSLAERIRHPRNDFQMQDDLLTVDAILRKLAELRPVAWISRDNVLGKTHYDALPIQSIQPGVYTHKALYQLSELLTDE